MSKIYEALKRAERERELAQERPPARPVPVQPAPAEATSSDEDYRRLRAGLVFLAGPSALHTILVTAARHGEGATHVAIGLARALAAERDTRVLLVEANLRSPGFTEILSLQNSSGVADFVAGQANPDALVKRIDALNLSVVAAGSALATVDCEAIGNLVVRLKPDFDFVVIDAPPVNRYADTPILAGKVDGVILVVEADRTPVVDAETAKRNLDMAGARILGVVLNRRRSYVPAMLQALF